MISEETREFIAAMGWYFFTYPHIKERADKIAQRIAELETKRTKKD